MEDRVGDRRADAGRAELADPAGAERARVRVNLVDEVDLDRGHVRADRDEVAGQVLRQEAPEAVVDLRRLQQRLADPQEMPPIIWLRAVFGLMIRPAL